ncbi:MAG: tRNA lysidine(34) synthetase TilS [Abditibacteriota bacterium]|nr:tRNA lysidine(34) synthetase TilS [Abditibacteriota bacterium]
MKIIVSLSGGPDSVALLHKLYKDNLTLAVHFNHHLRENANKDEAFCVDLCQKLGVEINVIHLNVYEYVKTTKTTLEEGARELRYKYLFDILRETDFDKIALGHNLNDKCETILMNIVRGTGIEGLNGLKAEKGNIIRPLINMTKDQIYDYLKENNLSYCFDETNLENNYTRNKFRNIIIPSLLEINQNLFGSLSRLASIAEETENYMEEETQKAINALENAPSPLQINSLPKAIKHRVIRELIVKVKGTTKDISLKEIERISEFLDKGEEFVSFLDTGELFAELKGGIFKIKKVKSIEKPEPFSYIIDKDEIYIKEINKTLIIKRIDEEIKYNKKRFYFDRDEGFDFSLTNIEPSVKIQPLGLKGHKKISDILKDNKVPTETRYMNIVLYKGNCPVWVPGVVMGEKARTKSPTHFMELK